jgi:hypothetical protein
MPRITATAAFTAVAAISVAFCASPAISADWIFDNGPYTRSATTGKRVDQYKALPQVDRIPFEKFFSEDGPHPAGLDWWTDWGWGGWGFDGYGGGFGGFDSPDMLGGNYGFPGAYIYPWGVP